MDLNVIGMAVVAMRVVHREHVSRLLAENRREPLRGLVDVGLPEAGGVVVLLPAVHPRVRVSQELDPVDAQDRGRSHGLSDAAIRQRLALVQIVGHLPELATRGHHEHHPMAVRRQRERSCRPS